jgi:phenylalanyl-tRNA synthetase beta chain
MRISPKWLRELVQVKVDDVRLASDLTAVGMAVEKTYADGTFEMEITTNRVDAMNHYGIAREISAIYDVALPPLTANLPKSAGKPKISVAIEVPEFCARFTGRGIENVRIGASQEKVQRRFRELEQKPINSAADATNYVMLLMGKPTHAFDADKLAGGRIIIRMARPGEALKTLDGVERKLHEDDVVVADAEKPVALAGVMGGWETMITESTKNVFIESAWWDPVAIRKTARRYGMHTDASHRFERGADWASCPISTDLVAELILESGGELAGEQVDVIARKVGHNPVSLSRSELLRILGKEIAAQEVQRVARLGFGLSPSRGGKDQRNGHAVSIPSWRLDVEREIDVIEEVARIHGYNDFPNTLPPFAGAVVELPQAEKESKLRQRLLALGYHEALSSTFIPREESQRFSDSAAVEIANPLNEEASAMRTTLIPGMLDMVAYNLNRGVAQVRLFEYGHVYSMLRDNTEERPSLCIAATADGMGDGSKDAVTIFRRFKGDVEAVARLFEGELEFDTQTPQFFHPSRSARALLDGRAVARFGLLHPSVTAARKLRDEVYLAEIDVDRLFTSELRKPRYERLPRYPAVRRDFSFVFDEGVTFERISAAIRALQVTELREIEPAEIFRGGNVPAGKFSILLRTTFQSAERTLRDDEVNAWAASIINNLQQLGGTLRD